MTSSPFTAVYDACVLYPAPLRDFLMWLALSGCFRARWSVDIHDEWKRNLLRNRADLTAAQLDRTASLMDRAIPDALVTGYEALIGGLTLPDANDRHVIVTFNQKDFPEEVLSIYGVEAQHPDVFVDNLFDLEPAAVVAAARRQRETLKHPPMIVERYLEILQRLGMVQTCKALEAYRTII
ncbi:PIN domain-containing protein [Burkholderia cepacia]|uniref:PIN domain-containing protein n=1 Tax=Burkholderia cepacia TaxID=292 RepID=UPI001CF1A1E7|nr:PIN domain-containing protein [Burkholderia cepacia]MCA8158628.1 PIN domain-containing protein [Burkholderia cepacia]